MKRVLDDIKVFCTVVETQSLKKASEVLGIPHSTVSRRIDSLENALELHLLHRTTREVKITTRGEQLYRDCSPLITSLADSIQLAIDDEVQFKGRLSVSMPVRAGIDFLGNWLIDFAAEHEELNLNIELSNTNKNLVADEIDLAFRVGPLVDSSAVALRLWDIPYTLCATADFMSEHGIEKNQLTRHQISHLPAVVTRPALKWSFSDAQGNDVKVEPNSCLEVDDLGLACHAICSGKYLGFLPNTMIKDQKVVELDLADHGAVTRVMYAYYLGRRHSISQIKHIVAYIKERKIIETPTVI